MVGDKVHDDPRDAATSGGCARRSARWGRRRARRDLARRAAARRGDAAGRVLRHRAVAGGTPTSTRAWSCRPRSWSSAQLGPAGDPQPDADARGAARRGLPAVRRVSLDDVADVAAAARRPRPCSPWRRPGRRPRPRRSRWTGPRSGCAATWRGRWARRGRRRRRASAPASPPLRVVIAGHDLKFFTPLIELLPAAAGPGGQGRPVGRARQARRGQSRELAAWADVVICEWCGPNAVWYSRHKRRGSRLLVRLHRFELHSPYPGQVKIGDVDQVICVSKHYARLTREHTGWPAAKVVDGAERRSTSPSSTGPSSTAPRFHLGMIGMVPSRKRLDLALDVLEELRRDDDRYLLFVKSGMPWEHWWVWQNPAEREHYSERAAPGAAVAAAARRGGVRRRGPRRAPPGCAGSASCCPPATTRAFHVAPAEGMASRAVPVIRHWPGAETIYDTRWIHRDAGRDGRAIIALGSIRRLAARPGETRTSRRAAFDLARCAAAWHRPAHRGPGPGAGPGLR